MGLYRRTPGHCQAAAYALISISGHPFRWWLSSTRNEAVLFPSPSHSRAIPSTFPRPLISLGFTVFKFDSFARGGLKWYGLIYSCNLLTRPDRAPVKWRGRWPKFAAVYVSMESATQAQYEGESRVSIIFARTYQSLSLEFNASQAINESGPVENCQGSLRSFT